MHFSTRAIKFAAFTSIWLGTAACLPNSNGEDEVIDRDIAVIGGGASGTYAAVRLQELGQSVVLIEKEKQLGGHTDTYYDPSGTPIDYGVWVYSNNSDATRFFDYLNITVTGQLFEQNPGNILRYDLRTGESVPPPQGDMVAAMARYAGVLSQHPYLADGWDLPYPVPEDLLLPFKEFIEKYDLGPAVETLTLYVQGYGDILNYPAVYIMKYFSMRVVLGGQLGFQRPVSGANMDIYKAAERVLGENVLLNSHIAKMSRCSENHKHNILVYTPHGPKHIRAKKVIVAIPPLPESLKNFDLDPREYKLFCKFHATGYYNSIVHLSDFPEDQQVVNKAVDTPYNVAAIPGSYVFFPAPVQDLYVGYYGGGYGPTPLNEVKESLIEDALSLREAGYPVSNPGIVAFGNHYPFGLHVSAEEIAGGFYRELYGLQGYRGTYYTGAAFHEHDSAALWEFTERLLRERVLVD